MKAVRTSLIAGLIATCLTACATSPTGRSQLLLYSDTELTQLGDKAFASMKENLVISKKVTQNRYVNCVADAITTNVPKAIFPGDWEIVVFEDEQVNAFALPGGKIGVYTGLLGVAENQHQLAAVIGHEIAHVIAEHGNERMSQSKVIGVGKEVAGQIFDANDIPLSDSIMAALGFGVDVGVRLPFSRTHETEADVIGLRLMAKSGFDPRQSINLWQNMDASSDGNRPPEILSTHPSPQTRIQDLQDNMSTAMADYQNAQSKPNCKA